MQLHGLTLILLGGTLDAGQCPHQVEGLILNQALHLWGQQDVYDDQLPEDVLTGGLFGGSLIEYVLQGYMELRFVNEDVLIGEEGLHVVGELGDHLSLSHLDEPLI